jgi:hypothetical protein
MHALIIELEDWFDMDIVARSQQQKKLDTHARLKRQRLLGC